MIFVQLSLTLAILAVCAFAPGFFFVRRLRWTPLEKLCGAVGLSLVLVFLAAFALFVFAHGAFTSGSFALTAACTVMGGLAWPDTRALLATARVRRVAVAFGFLLVWTLVMLATIRHYSGAGWTGDWLEHFDRTLVYLYHLPAGLEIFGGYSVPSRPPLAHVFTAFVMAQTQDHFENFQFVFGFLNLLSFLPCCLMLPLIARPWKFGVLPLTCIFGLSPVMMVNATLTGTKPFAVFFVVLAVAFYLRGWKKQDRSRLCAAFLAIAAGCVAHYSAVPYALFLAFHYLIAVFPGRRERWRELASIAGAGAAPLLAWFGWCIATFGFGGSFMAAANTSVGYKQRAGESHLLKSLANLFDAIVPHVARDWSLVQAWGQPNTLGYLRDNAFLIYQTSLVFTMGAIGGPLVWWLLVRALRRPNRPERNFWLALVPVLIAACFLLAGERDYFGQAHIILISMMAMGLVLLAANFTSRRMLGLLIVAGCAVDFSLGLFLHLRIEHLESTPDPSVFARIQVSGVKLDLVPASSQTLGRPTGGNWFRKHQYALSEKWLQNLQAAHANGRRLAPSQEAARKVLVEVVQQDDTMFGGWFKRHGGELVFFGDHFGDSDFTSLLLAAGGVGMLWKLARYAPPRPKPVLRRRK